MALHPTERSLAQRIEDLTNELAYIDHFPERMGHLERLVRKIAIIGLIKELRMMQLYWACPIEEFHSQFPGALS